LRTWRRRKENKQETDKVKKGEEKKEEDKKIREDDKGMDRILNRQRE